MTAWPSLPRLAAAERRWRCAEHGCKARMRREYEITVRNELMADVYMARKDRQLSLTIARAFKQGSRADVGAAC